MTVSSQKIIPFFTFSGQSEEAMNFYGGLFAGFEVLSIRRYGPNEPGPEGSVMHATFALHGQQFMCSDSFVTHEWGFTPAISFYVRCDSQAEIQRLYEGLAQDGQVFMPLGEYPFARQFAWVGDRFGVTWQLALD